MAIHSLFPTGSSLSVVSQTLARLTNVTEYLAAEMPTEVSQSHADLWQEAVRDGDTERLIEDIRTFDVFPIRHLDDDSLFILRNLAYSDPNLRAALQTSAENLELSVGVSRPLTLSVFAGRPASGFPDRGIAVFLGADDEAAVPPESSLQLFTVSPPPEPSEEDTQRISTPRTLRPKSHSAAIQDHFAREEIETIAAHDLAGVRVTPLSSPLKGELSGGLTRIGRFNFLGLNGAFAGGEWETLLSSVERFRGQVDILFLGALAVRQDAFADAAIATLQPRLALLPAAEAAAVHNFGYTTVFPVTSSTVSLEMHPLKQTIEVGDARRGHSIRLNRQNRFLDILEKVRPDVTRDLVRRIYGEMAAQGESERSKHAWRWAKITMSGVLPIALRYLLSLDFDPNRFARVQEREEALMRSIDEMTDPIGFRDTVPDHVWALKETLFRSGLLERRG